MKYRQDLSAIRAATALQGGPLALLNEVLERRIRSNLGLTPAEVRAAARLLAAAESDPVVPAATAVLVPFDRGGKAPTREEG
jgi:hypothetical protein